LTALLANTIKKVFLSLLHSTLIPCQHF